MQCWSIAIIILLYYLVSCGFSSCFLFQRFFFIVILVFVPFSIRYTCPSHFTICCFINCSIDGSPHSYSRSLFVFPCYTPSTFYPPYILRNIFLSQIFNLDSFTSPSFQASLPYVTLVSELCYYFGLSRRSF